MHVQAMLRNGFGFDLDIVHDLPLYGWTEDQDPHEDDPIIVAFNGLVFSLPFVKIIVGRFL